MSRILVLSLLSSSIAFAQPKRAIGTIAAPPPATPAPAPAPTPAAAPAPAKPGEPALPPALGEKEALQECRKYPAGKKFKWEMRGEIDLMGLLNAMTPMLCRPFVVPSSIRQSKVTILAPDTMTAPEAYRMFLSALDGMGLTVQPEGKVLKIIESNRARETAIPIIGADGASPANDAFVTRLLRLKWAELNDVKTVLDRLKSKDGDITVYPPTSTLVITDLGVNIRKMEEVVSQLDLPTSGERVFVIKLHTVSATEMSNLLQQVFSVGKGAAATTSTTPGAPGRPRINMAPTGQAGGAQHSEPHSAQYAGSDSQISQIIPDDPRGLLVIVATDRAYQRVLALVHRIDQQNLRPGESVSDHVHVVPLANANADDVAGTLGGLGAAVSRGGSSTAAPPRPGMAPTTPGSPAGSAANRSSLFESEVRIASDKPTNSLVILAQGRDWVTLRDLIRRLDIPRRQVFVEVVILEITVDNSRSLGVGWHGGAPVGTGSGQSLIFGGSEPDPSVNSLLFSPSALTGLAAGIRGPNIPDAATLLGLPPGTSVPSFGVFIQAIQTNGDVNVISLPHILTTDNEKASISVGQNLPFPGAIGGFTGIGGVPGASGTTGTSGSVGLGTSVQRQDVTLKIELTPHVNDGDFVRLELDGDIQDVVNPNYNGLGPATSKRSVKSVVTVRDQQSIVIGGLIKDSISETSEKTPLLGDIPILGYLFKRTTKSMTKQNLLIVLTPYIIKDPSDLRRIFDRKIRERREFVERNSAFRDEQDFEADVDYKRKRGVLAEINLSGIEAQREASDLRAAEAALRARDFEGPVDAMPVPKTAVPVPLAPGQSTVPMPVPPPLTPVPTPEIRR